jgi:hypothetical protein
LLIILFLLGMQVTRFRVQRFKGSGFWLLAVDI